MDGMLMGPPAVDLARDPNMPSKAEQLRVLALQLSTQVMVEMIRTAAGTQYKGGSLDIGVTPDNYGAHIAKAAEAMEKYLRK